MKEKLLEAFSELGFKPEEDEGGNYVFAYENINLLFLYNENDEDFLNIAIPCIYEQDEENIAKLFAMQESINSTLKYVKAYTIGGKVWLFYERELFGGEDLPALISRMVLRLESALRFAWDNQKKIDKEFDDSPAEEITAEECDDHTNE